SVGGEDSVNQYESKRIAPANTIKYLHIDALCCLIKFAVTVANRTPIITAGRANCAQSAGNDLKIGIFLYHFANHFLEGCTIQKQEILVQVFYCKAQRG